MLVRAEIRIIRRRIYLVPILAILLAGVALVSAESKVLTAESAPDTQHPARSEATARQHLAVGTPTCIPDADFTIGQSSGAAIVPGTTDTGNHCEFCTTP